MSAIPILLAFIAAFTAFVVFTAVMIYTQRRSEGRATPFS